MKRAENKPARILIVDDHPIVQEAYRQLINRQKDLQVCGAAADADSAMQLVKQGCPDLALIDLSLKESSGLDLIERVMSRCPQLKVLVVSTYDESLFAERVLNAGAKGYVNKQEATDELIDAIRRVLDGKVYLSSDMTDHMLQRAAGDTNNIGQTLEQALTNRELEVFELIGHGLTVRDVAARLHLSPKTVERYRENIKQKLHIPCATDLVRRPTQWVLENS